MLGSFGPGRQEGSAGRACGTSARTRSPGESRVGCESSAGVGWFGCHGCACVRSSDGRFSCGRGQAQRTTRRRFSSRSRSGQTGRASINRSLGGTAGQRSTGIPRFACEAGDRDFARVSPDRSRLSPGPCSRGQGLASSLTQLGLASALERSRHLAGAALWLPSSRQSECCSRSIGDGARGQARGSTRPATGGCRCGETRRIHASGFSDIDSLSDRFCGSPCSATSRLRGASQLSTTSRCGGPSFQAGIGGCELRSETGADVGATQFDLTRRREIC